jgi:hypothetical protein
MGPALDPFRLLLISLAGWLNQRQQGVTDCLQEKNRVLRESSWFHAGRAGSSVKGLR